MGVVAFDTLKLARRLLGAGFSREQADGAAEALAETLTGEIATKGDLAEAKLELKGEINALRTEVKADIAFLRAEIKTDIATVRTEISSLRTDTAKWIVGALIINIAAFFGAVVAVWQLAHK